MSENVIKAGGSRVWQTGVSQRNEKGSSVQTNTQTDTEPHIVNLTTRVCSNERDLISSEYYQLFYVGLDIQRPGFAEQTRGKRD